MYHRRSLVYIIGNATRIVFIKLAGNYLHVYYTEAFFIFIEVS